VVDSLGLVVVVEAAVVGGVVADGVLTSNHNAPNARNSAASSADDPRRPTRPEIGPRILTMKAVGLRIRPTLARPGNLSLHGEGL
jgi:hypothetical protein